MLRSAKRKKTATVMPKNNESLEHCNFQEQHSHESDD